MKSFRFFAMALAIAAFLLPAPSVRAQTTPPNQSTANGTATVVLNQMGPANDPLNGEDAGGGGSGTYSSVDPTNATGNAAASGTATGSNTGPVLSTNGTTISANGNAKSVINASTNATGATANVSISIGANQGTWSGTTPDPNATTFANAGEYTFGGGNGTGSGSGTLNQTGAGSASGENAVTTIDVGGINVTSIFKTDGLSTAAITATSTDPTAQQQISAVVSGGFAANGASLAGDPSSGSWSDAAANGGATYFASNPNSGTQIIGAGEVSGKTNAVVNANTPNQVSVSASSVVASQGQTK